MGTAASVVLTVVGLLLVAAALADVYGTLWSATGAGPLSLVVTRGVWRASRRRRWWDQAGPLAMVAVVGSWVLLAVVGWALVHLPRLGDTLTYTGSLAPDGRSSVLDALYVSLVVLTTLGFGDVVATSGTYGLVVATEALMGFGILTAAVSWVLQVQSAVNRRRSFARSVAALRRADEDAEGFTPTPDLLLELSRGVAAAHTDLRDSVPSYWFRDSDPAQALPTALRFVQELARRAEGAPGPALRSGARAAAEAYDGVAATLDERIVPAGPDDAVVRYARDHGVDVDY